MQQVMLLGRATRDGEVATSKEGKSYARFGVAVNEYKGKDLQYQPSFYNVLVFNKSHDKADKVKKGDYVMVEGKPDVDPYISKEGEAKANLVVLANKWRVLK